MELDELLDLYRTALLDDVIPFWMRHAVDPDGGINSCISDDGRIISRDRWSWSQWRAVYVFSKLYRRIEARTEWLDTAKSICRFMTEHGPLPNGHWALQQDASGNVLRSYESIYADGFAIYGLTELAEATGEKSYADLALETFHAVESALRLPEPPPAWPYPIPAGCAAHAVSMIFSLVFHELALTTGDSEAERAALREHRRVMDVFLREDRGVVLEVIGADGSEAPAPIGTVVVPGHAIESMWFQMHIARDRGGAATTQRCVEAIRRHLELGWDPSCGGLLLAVDADGRNEVGWGFADHKLWWPHTEALYATLLAYEHCREDWCLEWHERVREYSWQHYPDTVHGEWRQKLDRQGRPFRGTVALPVKDPFHLPRALIYCIDVLQRLVA